MTKDTRSLAQRWQENLDAILNVNSKALDKYLELQAYCRLNPDSDLTKEMDELVNIKNNMKVFTDEISFMRKVGDEYGFMRKVGDEYGFIRVVK